MDIIYSQAVATIIALSAVNPESGLAGVGRNTLMPSYSYDRIYNHSLRVRAPYLSEYLLNAHYESRAWTFQESLLSKRCLIFTNTKTYFHCSFGLLDMNESQVQNNDLSCSAHYTLPNCLLSTPATRAGKERWSHGFPGYAQLVRKYTCRHLSYSSDALNAFSGLLELFKHRFGGEMISGLPSKFFDVALLWVWEDERLQYKRNFHFPSWSWAGWIGPVQYLALLDSLPPFSENNLDPCQLKCVIARFQHSRQTSKREIDRDILEMESPDKNASDILESSIDSVKERTTRDILEFEALTVNIDRIREFKLRNHNLSITQGVYGAMISTGHNLEGYEQHCTDLVLLSQFSPPSSNQGVSKNLERIYFDSNNFPTENRSFLNIVMIIGWNPERDFAERMGLCVVHEDIWNQLDPQLKHITLA